MAQITPTCNRKSARRAARGGALALLTVLALAGCTGLPDRSPARAAASGTASGAEDPLVSDSLYGNYLAGRQALLDFDTEAAASLLNAALADDPDNQQLLQKALYADLAEGQMLTALEIARQIGKLAPHDPAADITRAVFDMRSGRYDAAIERMGVYNRDDQFGMLGLLTVAWAKVGKGDRLGAIEAAQTLANKPGFGVFGLYHLALINQYFDENRAAAAYYQETLQKSQGGIARVVQAYARLLADSGEPGEARLTLMNALELPGSAALRADLAILSQGGTLPRLVPTVADGMAEVLVGSANVVEREGSPWAIIFLRMALEMQPSFDMARLTLAALLEGHKHYDQAIAQYRDIRPDSPYAEAAGIRISWALFDSKRQEQAFTLLRQLSQKYPNSIEEPVALGDMLRSRDRFAEAAEQYTVAVDRLGKPEPRNWALYYARGIAYERSKQWPKAEADFKTALDLSPDQPEVLNYLGYSWVDRGEHLDQATAMIEKAVEARPRDGYIVDSLGWAMYRQGRYADAVNWLEKAIELSPGDPTINDHLGDALWQVGRVEEARFQWQRALSLKPDADLEPAIRKKLDGAPPQGR